MRKSYSSYSLLTLGGLLLAGSCSIIAEVDRTKIPQDGGTNPEGGQGTGGTSGTGGTTGGTSGTGGDTGGSSGSSGTGGTSGEGGMGGEPGTGGEDMGGAGMGGAGSGGAPGAECGDGVNDAGEGCDDDGTANGDGCSSTCTVETGWSCTTVNPSACTPICGDGIDVGAAEACDDRNMLACGTCAGSANGTGAGCAAAVAPTAATGTITPVTVADIDDGTSFTIDDGYNAAVTFEFDSNGSVANSATLIGITYDPNTTTNAQLQTAIMTAVNNASLLISATAGTAPAVTLTNERLSKIGNEPITKGGPNSGADVTVVGMTGGLAGDCPLGTPCSADADCATLNCSNSTNLCVN